MDKQALTTDNTPIVVRLQQAYAKFGITACSGLNSHLFFNYFPAPFTFFFKDGEILTQHLGISLHEVLFLESLFRGYHPKNILCIGNGWGLSSLACAMLNPEATVVSIDAALDEDSTKGLELTQQIVENEALNLAVLKGKSPEDVPAVVEKYFDGPIDCFFIDALHTNEAQAKDFRVAITHSHPGSLFLFHDVLLFGMGDSLNEVAAEADLNTKILWSTPSGMGTAFGPEVPSHAKQVLEAFSPDEKLVSRLWRGARVASTDFMGELQLNQRQLQLMSQWVQKIRVDG